MSSFSLSEKVAIAVGAAFILFGVACSYFDAHPPQVCITADQLHDGGADAR